jgi:hypothetical protein
MPPALSEEVDSMSNNDDDPETINPPLKLETDQRQALP